MIWFYRTAANWSTWLAIYLALCLVILGVMVYARPILIKRYSTAKVAESWDQWRETARLNSGQDGVAITGPVQRRVPKSAEPPAVILLRDHFPALVASAIFFPSLVYWFTAFVVRGMAQEHLRASTSGNLPAAGN